MFFFSSFVFAHLIFSVLCCTNVRREIKEHKSNIVFLLYTTRRLLEWPCLGRSLNSIPVITVRCSHQTASAVLLFEHLIWKSAHLCTFTNPIYIFIILFGVSAILFWTVAHFLGQRIIGNLSACLWANRSSFFFADKGSRDFFVASYVCLRVFMCVCAYVRSSVSSPSTLHYFKQLGFFNHRALYGGHAYKCCGGVVGGGESI